MGRDRRSLLAALAAATLASCFSASPETKARSFAPYCDRIVDGAPLAEFLSARTAFAVLAVRPTPEHGVFVGGWGATAVPIAADGYLLTAAHALQHDGPHRSFVMYPGSDDGHGFRVVWNGFDEAGLDLAVIHVESPPPAVFTWSPALARGTKVVSAGYVDKTLAFAGGELHEDLRSDGAVAWRVTHSVPLAHGDSGGPLCTLDGELVAVNYGGEALTPFGGVLRSVALRPDPDWLAGLLARDRRERLRRRGDR